MQLFAYHSANKSREILICCSKRQIAVIITTREHHE